MNTDWLLQVANHREQFSSLIKDKRIRSAEHDHPVHWTEHLLHSELEEDD